MKRKRLLTAILSMVLIFMVGLNNNVAFAKAKAVKKPELKIVTQPAAEYKVGSPVTFTVTSANYSGKVEYRVNIYNNSTKKTMELWSNIPGYYNSSLKTAGNSKYTVSWPTTNIAPGSYTIKVFVKRAGVKVSYDSYISTKAFTLKLDKKKLDTKTISKNSSSLVLLKTYDIDGKEYGSGSGFIISNDGKVVTNYHVIDKATKIKAIAYDGKEFEVSGVFNYDVDRDIAILNIKDLSTYPCLALGDSSNLELGEEIVAIGSPMGLQNTISTGIISSIRKNLIRDLKDSTDIQITAPISSGSSGGALFNVYGELVGMTYAGYEEGQNLNFAIPINEVKDVFKNISKDSISLESTMVKIYDQYELKKCSDFSQYMFQHYSTCEGEKQDYELDMIDIYPKAEGNNVVNVDLIVHTKKYKDFVKPIDIANVFKWIAKIEKEVLTKYPDKEINGTIMLQEYYTQKPTDFPEDRVFEVKEQYYVDANKKWAVEIPFISFGANNEGVYCCEIDKDGKFEGQGYYIWADGSVYSGNWSGDEMNGEGLYIWEDGEMYLGEFKDSKKHGKGEYIYANGTIQKGRWENDMYIGE